MWPKNGGDWQNFEIFLKAGDHTAKARDVQVAILLNFLGEEAVEPFNTFDLNDNQRKSFNNVIAAFKNYANRRRNVVVEWYLFNCQVQEQNKKFDEFLMDLQKLIKYCEYGTLNDSIIRDRIVIGISDKQIQERLLRETELTLQKTIEICRAAEISKTQSDIIERKTDVHLINKRNSFSDGVSSSPGSFKLAKPKLGNSPSQGNSAARKLNSSKDNFVYLCKKCGTQHRRAECPAYGKMCRSCKGLNHYSVGCPNKKSKHLKDYDYKNKNLSLHSLSQSVIVDSVYSKNRQASWIKKYR